MRYTNKNLKVLYYNRNLSIETGTFTLNEEYDFINLSLLTPGKIETFYAKDFIDKAAYCQRIVFDIVDKVFSKGQVDADESIEVSPYLFYKNVEFAIWRADQRKKQQESVSSVLSSLNESRDDSIDSSLYLASEQASKIEKDGSSVWSSNINGTHPNKGPNSISDATSDVSSVYKLGTEQWMGSEKHEMSENFKFSETNTNTDNQSNLDDPYKPDPRLAAMRKKVKRVSKKNGDVQNKEYTGKATMPVETNTDKLKPAKQGYTGAFSYTGPKNEAMVTQNELDSKKRVSKFDTEEGKGVPLNTFDEKDKKGGLNDSENSGQLSFLETLQQKENERYYNMLKAKNIREGKSNLKESLEIIDEERTSNTPLSEWRTLDKDNSQGDSKLKDRTFGKSVQLQNE